jgi:hypothetical protein
VELVIGALVVIQLLVMIIFVFMRQLINDIGRRVILQDRGMDALAELSEATANSVIRLRADYDKVLELTEKIKKRKS